MKAWISLSATPPSIFISTSCPWTRLGLADPDYRRRLLRWGFVAEKEVFKQARLEPESLFPEIRSLTNPDLTFAMRNARRVNEFKLEGDDSYKMDTFAGNGFVLIGDAARFVESDLFFSVVSVALYSAKYSSERIKYAFGHNDFSEATTQAVGEEAAFRTRNPVRIHPAGR